jgi:hypothetical protein
MFHVEKLFVQENFFLEMKKKVVFENICSGRIAAILVQCDEDHRVPIMRSTTIYHHPVQTSPFAWIASQNMILKPCNNIMAEIYTDVYKTMKYHSDQATDLADGSFICIFSCYKTPHLPHSRVLKTKNKTTMEETEIVLEHGSMILFSAETNREYLHKIILQNANGNEWLGLTMRCSKTFVHPFSLELWETAEQKRELFRLRALENQNIETNVFNATLSPSDLLPPI